MDRDFAPFLSRLLLPFLLVWHVVTASVEVSNGLWTTGTEIGRITIFRIDPMISGTETCSIVVVSSGNDGGGARFVSNIFDVDICSGASRIAGNDGVDAWEESAETR